MAKLADALDLGSSGLSMGVQVPSPAPKKFFTRTKFEFFFALRPPGYEENSKNYYFFEFLEDFSSLDANDIIRRYSYEIL